MQRFLSTASSVGTGLAAAVFVLLPFHAALTVWAGTTFGHYEPVRLWKEFLLLLLVPIAIYLVCAYRPLRQVFRWPVFWLIMAYLAVHIIWSIIAYWQDAVTLKATLYAFIVNLRFLAFMLICLALAATSPWLRMHWLKLLCIPAAVVVGFGLLQAFVLPPDILRHLGFGPETIPAFQTVDQKSDYVRVQSTLRGPNPLGAYLLVVITAALAMVWAKTTQRRVKTSLLVLAGAAGVVLAFTYSRSAYIGIAIALLVVCWLVWQSKIARRWLLAGTIVLSVAGMAAFVSLKQNDLFQNVVFHTDETSIAQTSNEGHMAALERGVDDVLTEPLGGGPGSAGPASQYNDEVRIAENYYLQIGQEVGWLGIALFIAICLGVLATLWPRRHETLSAVLIASFIGLSVINLFSHAWADDTLSLVWWGLAGIALAPAILKTGGREKA